MASVSRTTTIYGAGANRVDLYMKVSESSVDEATNTSRLTVYLALKCYGYSSVVYQIGDAYVSIDGTKVGRKTSGSKVISDGESWYIVNGASYTVTHDSDGTGSVSCRGYFNTYSTSAATLTLTPISMVASGVFAENPVTITSSTTDPALTFTVQPRNANYFHYVTLYTGNLLYPAMQGWAEDNSNTFTATVNDILVGFQYSASNTASAVVETYSEKNRLDSYKIGETTVSCGVLIDTSTIHPEITSLTVSPNTTPISGQIVAGYSNAIIGVGGTSFTYIVTAILSKGTIASTTWSYATTNILPASDTDYTVTANITLADRRGGKDTGSTTFTVKGYTRPIPKITAYRVASSGSTTKDEAGTYVYVNTSETITSLGSNSIQSKSLTYSGDVSGTINSTPAWIALSESQGMTLTYTVTDKVTSGTAIKSVPVAIYPLDLYQENGSVGAAFGGIAEGGLVRSFLPFAAQLPMVTEESNASSTLDSRSGIMTRGHYNGAQTFTIPTGTSSGWYAIIVRSRNNSTTFTCGGSDGLIIRGQTAIQTSYTVSGLGTYIIIRVAGTRLALCSI